MDEAQLSEIFVSYSRTDRSLVVPVVQLLRANRTLVFQDVDGIRPGAKWRPAIHSALERATLVVVFWCAHAAASEEVSAEWTYAITHGKDLLPLLLDSTPLPNRLAEFQWVDFRDVAGSTHNDIAAVPSRSVLRKSLRLLASYVAFPLLLVALVWYSSPALGCSVAALILSFTAAIALLSRGTPRSEARSIFKSLTVGMLLSFALFVLLVFLTLLRPENASFIEIKQPVPRWDPFVFFTAIGIIAAIIIASRSLWLWAAAKVRATRPRADVIVKVSALLEAEIMRRAA